MFGLQLRYGPKDGPLSNQSKPTWTGFLIRLKTTVDCKTAVENQPEFDSKPAEDEMDGAGGGASGNDAAISSGGGVEEITVNVKFGGRTIPVTLSTDCRIKELKAMLQPLTNVLVRGQKLISKGKILTDDASLRDSDVKDGAKMMLMASQGLHQGDGPILKNAATKPISRSAVNAKAVELSVGKSRVDHWKRMGVISLSSSNLKAIPEEVWACGSSIRLLDASNNTIRGVPSQIANLTSLDRLDLSKNDIVDDSLSWEGVVQLKLSSLFLSQNHLTTLPPALGTMTSLVHVVVADNKLTSLPAEIGLMTELKTLNARNNRITSIDPSIGNCKYLLELDLSSNLLSEIPQTVGNLQNLKELYLSNNGLKAVPSSLFKNCTSLRKLDLHRTEITMNMLREMEGWNEFDERRRAKTQNLLDYRSLHSTDFDEGADVC